MKDNYDPYDIYDFEESERLREVSSRDKRQHNIPLSREGKGEEVQDIQLSSKSKEGTPSNDEKKKTVASYKGRGRRWGRK